MPGHNDWLVKALSDLKLAKKGIRDDDDTLDGSAYHTQQCAEKALKGFLIFCKQINHKTHDLEVLVELCSAIDAEFDKLMTDAEFLNPYAVNSRYPDDQFFVDREEVEQAIKTAERILNFVNKKVNEKPNMVMKIF